MAKATTKLNAQDRVTLFCAATGIDHAAVGILAHAMQSMTIRGFIAHNRESGAYGLDVPAPMPPSELNEMTEKLVRQVLPASGRPHGDRMNIANRLGLRDKAEQVSDDLGSPTNNEGRVSELVNEERVM